MTQLTPPGWYPDAMIQGQLRYWDGTAWTKHTAPAGPTVAQTPTPWMVPVGSYASAPIQQQPNWFLRHKVVSVVLALFVIGVIATASSGDSGDPSDNGATKTLVSDPASSSTPQEADAQSDDSEPEPEATESTAPPLTAAEIEAAEAQADQAEAEQRQAAKREAREAAREEAIAAHHNEIDAAEGYLDYSAFSRSGLIEQLEYEGYPTPRATFAVDHVRVNWFHQAARSASAYLDYTSFSRSGLIEQLEYEGFTPKQAAHGVQVAY